MTRDLPVVELLVTPDMSDLQLVHTFCDIVRSTVKRNIVNCNCLMTSL